MALHASINKSACGLVGWVISTCLGHSSSLFLPVARRDYEASLSSAAWIDEGAVLTSIKTAPRFV